jgi:hypothetical protein
VAEGERLILGVVRAAHARGRDSVRVVHGASTSALTHRNRTLRHALLDLLDEGALDAWVVSEVVTEGSTLLGLGVGRAADPRRLALPDCR